METIFTGDTLASLLSLTAMEIVLGIDNVVFVSILVSKLPPAQQDQGRFIGLGLALVFRVLLLLTISALAHLKEPLFTILNIGFSGRDLIMLGGGLFLIAKSTSEIHNKIEGMTERESVKAPPSFASLITQVVIIDVVFSLDSIITAIGLVEEVWIMITAVVISLAIMIFFAKAISTFIDKHPTMKMLALSFLLMIGVLLVAEGFDIHVPKGYVYFAMSFSLLVEMLNLQLRRKAKPTKVEVE